MSKTKIEWAEHVWNPVRGCSMAVGSEAGGCLNCYAARQAARGLPGNRFSDGSPLAVMRDSGPRWTGRVELQEHMLDIPLRRKKPTTYFVNSMSDLFHEDLPNDPIIRVFGVMGACPQHTFLVLTKRAQRMLEFCLSRGQEPLPNVWLGVSVEGRANFSIWNRIDLLRETPAALRFLSLEPLLGDLGTLNLEGIGWVILGAESGPGARISVVANFRSVLRQCKEAGVPAFVKQLGAYISGDPAEFPAAIHDDGDGHRTFRLQHPKGADPREWPEDLRVREFPE